MSAHMLTAAIAVDAARTALPVRNAQIEAVLELHEPFEYGGGGPESGDGAGCEECRYDDGSHWEWPCPTVRAIEEAM